MIDIADEKHKILDGTYSSRVIAGRQNKHIEGTREFEQKREHMERSSPGSMPAKINQDVDIQKLVDKYKGTGKIYFVDGSPYPREDIFSSAVIGATWIKTKGKYIDTCMFTIAYSKTGVHIFPKNEKGRV